MVTLKENLNRLLVVDTTLILDLDCFFYLIREVLAKRVVELREGLRTCPTAFSLMQRRPRRGACLPSSRAFLRIIKSLERFAVAGGNLLCCGCHPIN